MLHYLHNIKRMALPPADGGSGTGWVTGQIMTSCANGTGTSGSVTVSHIASSKWDDIIDINLHLDSTNNPPIATYVLDLTHAIRHTFSGLADGNYIVTLSSKSTLALKKLTTSLACAVPNTDPAEREILLEKMYVYDRPASGKEGDFRSVWKVRTWKFDTTTEKWYMAESEILVQPGDEPEHWITDSPFFGYCIPGTTRKKNFYYRHEGQVSVKEENAVECGFVEIRGCTDPTATNYNADATIDDGSCYYRPAKLGCTNPSATNYDPTATDDDGTCILPEPTREPVFQISMMNSLRFVRPSGELQTLDNRLFCTEHHRGIRNLGYFQKVQYGDDHAIQIRSNYATVTMSIRKYGTDELVATVPVETKMQNIGTSPLYGAYLKNHANGQTRIYFNTGNMPEPVSVGDTITVYNHIDSNGTYAVVDILQDTKARSPYLVINRPYKQSSETTTADIVFNLAQADYNVLEAVIDWAFPDGIYYVTVSADDPAFLGGMYTSEPVALKTEWPDTLLWEYRNNDNAFDINYTTGIVHRMRIEGEMRERLPGGQDEIHREPHNKITRLVGIPYRNVRVNTWLLPAWLHEKLSVVVKHDLLKVQGVEFQCLDGYEEPVYNKSTALYNGTVTLEQVEWFADHNDHDLGKGINSQPLLIVNGGFLRL